MVLEPIFRFQARLLRNRPFVRILDGQIAEKYEEPVRKAETEAAQPCRTATVELYPAQGNISKDTMLRDQRQLEEIGIRGCCTAQVQFYEVLICRWDRFYDISIRSVEGEA